MAWCGRCARSSCASLRVGGYHVRLQLVLWSLWRGMFNFTQQRSYARTSGLSAAGMISRYLSFTFFTAHTRSHEAALAQPLYALCCFVCYQCSVVTSQGPTVLVGAAGLLCVSRSAPCWSNPRRQRTFAVARSPQGQQQRLPRSAVITRRCLSASAASTLPPLQRLQKGF